MSSAAGPEESPDDEPGLAEMLRITRIVLGRAGVRAALLVGGELALALAGLFVTFGRAPTPETLACCAAPLLFLVGVHLHGMALACFGDALDDDAPPPGLLRVAIDAAWRTPRLLFALGTLILPAAFGVPGWIALRAVASGSLASGVALLASALGGALALAGLLLHARFSLMASVLIAVEDAGVNEAFWQVDGLSRGRTRLLLVASLSFFAATCLPGTGALLVPLWRARLGVVADAIEVALIVGAGAVGLLVHSALAVAVYALATRRSSEVQEGDIA